MQLETRSVRPNTALRHSATPNVKQQFLKPGSLLGQAFLLLALFSVSAVAAAAQQNQKLDRPIEVMPEKADDGGRPLSEIEEEMRAKRAIKYAEKEYQENVERARDLEALGNSIVESFKHRNNLSSEDLKKLDKIEKLAKSIRSAAGGSDDDTVIEKPPKDMASAMDMLSCLSNSLKEKVEKTSRHVISASVIDEANVLLELIRLVRTLPAKV